MNLQSWGCYPKIKNHVEKFFDNNSANIYLDKQQSFIAYGNGRSYGDSALNESILHMRPHDYFINFDDESGLLQVESGVLLSEIIEHFVPRGWFLQITPGTKLITVGGAIASDVHGKNHHLNGCFSECVKEFDIIQVDGSIISCTREKYPELFKATCGGMGLTGVIISAKIFLKKINSQFIDQTTIKTHNLEQTFEAFEQYQSSPYSVAWIDCLAKKGNIGRSLLMLGDFRNDGKLCYSPKDKLSIPFNFPSFALNNLSIRAFNWLYYGKVKEDKSKQRVDIDTFFYPLDAIAHWNRIYGKNGLTQYQCILPKDCSYDGLKEILAKIAESGKGSFLAVLKLYGKANDNYLSFPMEGYSLALDFKIEKGTLELLNQLDDILKQYKGRVYLTKDARVSKANFEQSYPMVNEFRKFRRKHQLDKVFQSLQSRRLGI
jgi:FAD/FMN-containing dehydrogenase